MPVKPSRQGSFGLLTNPLAWANYDPLLDKRYRHTALGPHVTDWLAHLEPFEGLELTPLDSYERTLSPFALKYPTLELSEVTASHMTHFLRRFKHPATREIRRKHLTNFFRWAVDIDERLDRDPS